jgi:hypothetical protein
MSWISALTEADEGNVRDPHDPTGFLSVAFPIGHGDAVNPAKCPKRSIPVRRSSGSTAAAAMTTKEQRRAVAEAVCGCLSSLPSVHNRLYSACSNPE